MAIVKAIKVKLGNRWLAALERELQACGLFFWCDPSGNFVLEKPKR